MRLRNKKELKMWDSIKDYGLFMCSTLERELCNGLVCKLCIKEFLESKNNAVAILLWKVWVVCG